ncbi:MAG: 30S ribosomal protein S1, partial [Bacteroidota bacterium]
RIVHIGESHVTVDIGFKSEGQVSVGEFPNINDMKIGDEVEVYLESVEDNDGQLVLSRKRADFMRIWERVTRSFQTGEVLRGRCMRRTKGGIVVDLMGIDAFLPGSQIDVRPVRDFDAFIGKEMDFRVVKVNHPSENVVVSHKVLVEEELSGQRKAILERLEKGQILEGHVKAITDFGVFVDLGGVDGLVHITDLSWGRVSHPSEVVKLDHTVNVVVLDFDQEKKRISLGMKQLLPHPWENIELKYPVGTKVPGKVVSLTDYGAFVEIEKGIEGLIHISEMSWTQHVKHPSQMVSMGQIVEAVILSLDKEGKKISLGMKQLEPDPWKTLLEKYPVGSKHTGSVRNLTNFGVFVELEEGVDGLVHISDLSWTKKIRHPGEVVKKSDKIDVVILAVDVDQRRISLGLKQVQDNPWEAFASKYQNGTEVEGKIVRIVEKGVIVELPLGVDGFVPLSQLSQTPIKNVAESFGIGTPLPLKVIEFDKGSKKIVLSVLEYLRGKEQQLIDEYVSAHKLTPMTLKDVLSTPLVPQETTVQDNTNPQ